MRRSRRHHMARFYCKQPELSETLARGSLIARGSMTRDASPLTFPARQEIMAEPGVRNPRVPVYALTKSREIHERLQPQGRGSICAYQQIDSRGSRHSGERDGGVSCSSERRSGARCPPALHQGVANRSREISQPRGLYGKESASSQVSCWLRCHLERCLLRAGASFKSPVA